jgi:hypothetical protein
MTDVRRIAAENSRAVWIIAIGLLVNAALYALVVYPLSQRVQSEQQQAGEATRERVAAKRTHDAARGTVTGKKQADEELQKFYREVLPPDLSGARRTLFPYLDQLARNSNLAPTGNSPMEIEAGGKKELRRLATTLTLRGEYSDIRRFIHELETAPEFLVLESVAVIQGSGTERGLQVTATVATYFRDAGNGN